MENSFWIVGLMVFLLLFLGFSLGVGLGVPSFENQEQKYKVMVAQSYRQGQIDAQEGRIVWRRYSVDKWVEVK